MRTFLQAALLVSIIVLGEVLVFLAVAGALAAMFFYAF